MKSILPDGAVSLHDGPFDHAVAFEAPQGRREGSLSYNRDSPPQPLPPASLIGVEFPFDLDVLVELDASAVLD